MRSGTDAALKREQVQAFLSIANFGKSVRDVYVTMREQNASDVLASRRVAIQPGEYPFGTATKLFRFGDVTYSLLVEKPL